MRDTRSRRILFTALVAGLLFATRVPVFLLALPDRLLDDSELTMTFSALNRLLGVPPTALNWPAGPLHMMGTTALVVDLVARTGTSLSQTTLLDSLAQTSREPWHALMLLRLVVMSATSVGFALLWLPLAALFKHRLAGALAAAVLATVPILWFHSQSAITDAVAVAFVAGALAVALKPKIAERDVLVAGVLAGLALASKVTILPVLPFVLGVLLDRHPAHVLRVIGVFGLGVAAGFAVGCPFLWTDPARLLKNVLANMLKQGTPMGLPRALALSVQVIPLWMIGGAAAGLVGCVRRRQWWTCAGALIAGALTLLVMARAGVVYPRYLFPVVPVVAVLAVLAVADLQAWLLARGRSDRAAARIALCALALMVMANTAAYAVQVPGGLAEFAPLDRIAADLRRLPSGSRVVVPYDNVLNYVAADATSESLRRIGQSCAMSLANPAALVTYTQTGGVVPQGARALSWVFNAQEQVCAAELALMAHARGRARLDVRVWMKPQLAPRFGFLTAADAVSLLRAGEVDAIVVDIAPADLGPPVRSYGAWHLFARGVQSKALAHAR